jgi:osomolarity two-component system response regulator SKN7
MQPNLGGIGLTEDGYNEMLHDMIEAANFNEGQAGESIGAVFLGVGMKRDHEDGEDGRDGKRGRFEVVE